MPLSPFFFRLGRVFGWILRACLVACAPLPALAAPEPAAFIHWRTCGDSFPKKECAVVRVPLDYDHPNGPQTELAVARIRATNPARRIGTLFLNPGGPGGSGVDLVLFGFGDYLSSELSGRFDIVGFDPRGVGASDPLRCFQSASARDEYLAESPVFPYRTWQQRPFFDRYRAIADLCVERSPAIAAHMSTADVARDLDLLRRATGNERLNYLGFSYGSLIGNTYAKLYPDRIRTLVIDGVLDPALWTRGWQIKSDRLNTLKEFKEFLRLCDEAGDECALTGPGGSASRYFALASALLSKPIVFPGGFKYTYDFLVDDTIGAMYIPEFWGGADGYAAFFAFLADASRSRPDAAQQAANLRFALIDRLRAAKPSRTAYDNGFEAYYGNHCADAQYPQRFATQRAIGEFAERGSLFGPHWWWLTAPVCADWPVAQDRHVGPWVVRTSAPALVIGNYFDGVTSYEGAVASSKLLVGSRLLSYAGWGHTAFSRNECITRHTVNYLLRRTLPPKGTVCPANDNPFALSLQRRAVSTVPAIGLPPSWLIH